MRHAAVAVVLLVTIGTTISTLWNGRRGRLTCGAPRHPKGRCRPKLRADQFGCGVHGISWVARDVVLGIVGAIALSLLFRNFEAALTWIGTTISESTA